MINSFNFLLQNLYNIFITKCIPMYRIAIHIYNIYIWTI